MSLDQITDLFKWMTIINLGVYLFSIILSILLKKTISTIHGKLFGIDEANVGIITYSYFGLYKIAIIIFCFVPYLSLLIINNS